MGTKLEMKNCSRFGHRSVNKTDDSRPCGVYILTGGERENKHDTIQGTFEGARDYGERGKVERGWGKPGVPAVGEPLQAGILSNLKEVTRCITQLSGGRAFQTEGTASPKP